MADPESRSLDILGVKPVADALLQVTKATIDGVSAFLGRICLPAAVEFGLLLQDNVRSWRATNAIRVLTAAQNRIGKLANTEPVYAHPRLVATIIDKASWTDDKVLQDMWGGLLASSCCADGHDDSNLIFVNMLTQLTHLQSRVVRYACENSEKALTASGLIMPNGDLEVDMSTIFSIAETEDIHRIDQDLDHLRGLELIRSGFHPSMLTVDITPSALALNLYVRCQGYRGSAVDYFGLNSGA